MNESVLRRSGRSSSMNGSSSPSMGMAVMSERSLSPSDELGRTPANRGAGGRGRFELPPYLLEGEPGRGLPLMSAGSEVRKGGTSEGGGRLGAPSTIETAREGGREGWYGMKVAGMGGISSAASLDDFVKWWFFLSFLLVESDVWASSRSGCFVLACRRLGPTSGAEKIAGHTLQRDFHQCTLVVTVDRRVAIARAHAGAVSACDYAMCTLEKDACEFSRVNRSKRRRTVFLDGGAWMRWTMLFVSRRMRRSWRGNSRSAFATPILPANNQLSIFLLPLHNQAQTPCTIWKWLVSLPKGSKALGPNSPVYHFLAHASSDAIAVLLPSLLELIHELFHRQGIGVLVFLVVVWILSFSVQVGTNRRWCNLNHLDG
ncbi:hypothetical protein KCU83_g6, partial [Aureobasidium melanogenum]